MMKNNNTNRTGPKIYSRTYKSVHETENNNTNTNYQGNKPYIKKHNYNIIKVFIEKNDHYTAPTRASNGSIGYDLFSTEDIIIPSQKAVLVPTGLKIAVPKGYEMQIRSRSGLCINNSVIVMNSPATIDTDYRGEIKVILFNLSGDDFTINKGDRIAQAVFASVTFAKFIEVEALNNTQRADKGFGHSGTSGESNYKDIHDENLENCSLDDDINEPLSQCSL